MTVSTTFFRVADQQTMVTDALDELIKEAGGVDQLSTPRGYSHLGLSILDAIYSLRSNYDSVVVPALERYCDEVGLDWDHLDTAKPEHGAKALLDHLGSWSESKRVTILTNHVAPGTSTRKHDLCAKVARVLLDNDVDTHDSLGPALTDFPGLEWEVRRLPGIGPAAWRYILNLSRVEKVKPDTMIVRWVSDAVGHQVGQAESAKLLESAAHELKTKHPGLTVRAADHLVWRKQSRRPLTAAKK